MDQQFRETLDLTSLEQTERFAAAIGARLKGGEVIEISGDLGAGKTTFTKALVAGAGSQDHVTSPSFTLRNDYQAREISIAHFDFYRLQDPGIVKDMLAEAMVDQQTAVVIEWAGIVDDILPIDRLQLVLVAISNQARRLELSGPQSLAYLLPEELKLK